MTQDLDQSLELIGGVIALVFGLLFLMDWLEDSMQQRACENRQSVWQNIVPHLPKRWSSRGRR